MNPQQPQNPSSPMPPQNSGAAPTPSAYPPQQPVQQAQPVQPLPYYQPQQPYAGQPQAAPYPQPVQVQPMQNIHPAQSYSQGQPQETLPIDYLNQIASTKKPTGIMSGKRKWLIVGLAVAFVVSIGLGLLNASKNNSPANLPNIVANMSSLQKVISEQKDNIKSNSLDSTTSTLDIFLTNTIRDYSSKAGIDSQKIDKDIVAQNNPADLTKTLEDARLNAKFDRIFASEMSRRLILMLSLLESVEKKSSNQEFKALVQKQVDDLTPIQQLYEKF